MKKGFTLIELLAVIVILAIIALIATPIVLNIIKDSKISSSERSAENYLSAVEQAIAKKKMYDIDFNPVNCVITTINSQSKLTCDGEDLSVEINGNSPESGVILISDGKISTGTYFNIDGNVVNLTDGKASIKNDNLKYLPNGTPIYYNPVTDTKLANETDCNNDIDCKIFYVLEDKGKDYSFVSLIMDRNFIDDTVPVEMTWCDQSKGISLSSTCNHDGLNPYINHIQDLWKGVVVSLPTNEQLLSTTCTMFSRSCPTWLYDHLDGTTNSVTGLYGYWTSSIYSDSGVWHMSYYGSPNGKNVDSNSGCGIRPVIIVSKSKLS